MMKNKVLTQDQEKAIETLKDACIIIYSASAEFDIWYLRKSINVMLRCRYSFGLPNRTNKTCSSLWTITPEGEVFNGYK